MLLWIATVAYAAAGIIALVALFREQVVSKNLFYTVGLIGWCTHTGALLLPAWQEGFLSFNLLNALSICIWMMISVLLISNLNKPLYNLFAFFMPMSSIVLIVGLFLPATPVDSGHSGGLLMHVFMALLAYSILAIATMQAVLVSFQNHHLHAHRVDSRLFKVLPPLQTMERLMFEWLYVGFGLLTVAMITGAFFLEDPWAQHVAYKSILTVIAWIFYAYLIFAHIKLGVRGPRASHLIYLGFSLLVVAFIGSKWFFEYVLASV